MSVSIAMTMYNGSSFLELQLESILAQTIQPDELIVCDDGSTDDSRAIFEAFVKNNGLSDKWHYNLNQNNKGYRDNFLDCAKMCKGDYIFFADQDDIWVPQKIEKMMDVFGKNDDALVVCCSVSCIDENGNNADTFLTRRRIGNGSVKKVKFEKQVSSMLSSGLTLAFKKECLEQTIGIIRRYNLQYDSPFGLIYSVKKAFFRIYLPLVLHRVHSNNASSPAYSLANRKFERHISGREIQLKSLKMILKEFASDLSEKQILKLKKEIHFREVALDSMKNHRILPLFVQIFRMGSMDNKSIDIANLLLTLRDKRTSSHINK